MKIIKPEHLSRKKKFQNRVSRNSLKKSVSKKNLYQKKKTVNKGSDLYTNWRDTKN